ncbi:hypothetical protein SVIOM342S_08495 [Streptomyces violaceorubidus]
MSVGYLALGLGDLLGRLALGVSHGPLGVCQGLLGLLDLAGRGSRSRSPGGRRIERLLEGVPEPGGAELDGPDGRAEGSYGRNGHGSRRSDGGHHVDDRTDQGSGRAEHGEWSRGSPRRRRPEVLAAEVMRPIVLAAPWSTSTWMFALRS